MLIFQDKLPQANRNAIIDKINSVSGNLGIDPNWLMAVIDYESAGSFSPSIVNSKSKATGLIQFMPETAIDLGTTTAALAQMSFIRQMDFVQAYYTPYKSRIKSYVDLYLATFYPVSMGKPNSYVIGSTPARQATIARQNPSFDPFKTGKVTVGAIKTAILKRVPPNLIKFITNGGGGLTLLGLAGVALAIYLITKKKKENGAR